MSAVLAFGITLFLATVVSALARRTVLSSAVLFLLAGFLIGDGALGIAHVTTRSSFVWTLAALALFSTLFTDGSRAGLSDIRHMWRLPGRALAFGLPLTLTTTALLAHWVVGVHWRDAFLLGAVLTPTDPVLASAVVQRTEFPAHLRQLLNVESGVNDGLALPIVLALLASYHAEPNFVGISLQVVGGVGVGVLVTWAATEAERIPGLGIAEGYHQFTGVAVAIIVYAISVLLGANEFLAAFAAGVTLRSLRAEMTEAFRHFGQGIADLLKFAGLLVFGALLVPDYFSDLSWRDAVFVLLTLFAVRPLALGIALFRADIARREKMVAAWFGPKGFASVIFAIMMLRSDAANATRLFQLAAVVIAFSILINSSTDILAARWFGEPAEERPEGGAEPPESGPEPDGHETPPGEPEPARSSAAARGGS